MFTAKKPESTYTPVPVGNHVARIYKLIEIGTVPEIYMGEEKMMPKMMIGFELLNERKVFTEAKGEEPYTINHEFTVSMGKKSNLRKFIENMFGIAFQDEEAYAFDFDNLIGEPLLLNVAHKIAKGSGNEYAFVQSASPIPKGLPVPPAHNPVVKLNYSEWDEKVFETLPNFLKDKMAKSDEFKKLRGFENNIIDGIPF